LGGESSLLPMKFFKYHLVCAFALFSYLLALAFPPAPPSIIYGSVRGEFGFSLTDGRTEILLLADDKVIQRSRVSESRIMGENYRLTLPIDLNPASGIYSVAALTPGDSTVYSFVAEREGTRIPVLRVESGDVSPESAAVKRIDFILGEDSDGDRLPDAWERLQVATFGLETDDPLSILGTGDFDHDGLSDFDEYIAGTFAIEFQDGFNFRIINAYEDDRVELMFLAIQNKKYRIEGSTDLITWSPVSFSVDSSSDVTDIFLANNTVYQMVMTEPGTTEAKVFYRLLVD
jgi:hypothetical protein